MANPPPVKPKKPSKMTAVQYQAFLHYVKTHKKLDAMRARQQKHRIHLRRKHYRATHHGAIQPDSFQPANLGYWVAGNNDILETCAMTALANTLFMDHHIRTSDDEIKAAGEKLSIASALDYIAEYGLNGYKVHDAWQLETLTPETFMRPGIILGVDTPQGPHAVVTTYFGHVVSWGCSMSFDKTWVPREAWMIVWERNNQWLDAAQS